MSRGFSLGSFEDRTESSEQLFLASKKAAEQQHLLSSALLENAQLKRVIATREAENASLSLEIHSLKAQLESSVMTEDSSTLKSMLDSANQEIVALKAELAKARSSLRSRDKTPERELKKHQAELKRARAEIARLTEKNEEADKAISRLERSLRSREMSSAQNSRIEDEVEHLRKENRELRLRVASIEGKSENSDMNYRVRTQIEEITSGIDQRMSTFEAAIENEITGLKDQISGIEATVISPRKSKSSRQKRQTTLQRLSAGIRAIQELSNQYASSRTTVREFDSDL